jgi:hypothetical protein
MRKCLCFLLSTLPIHRSSVQNEDIARLRLVVIRAGLETGIHSEYVNMEHELHGARFSKLQKIQNLNFEKIQKNTRV